MLALVTLLVLLALSVLVTRIATVALVHTGLSAQSAPLERALVRWPIYSCAMRG